MSISPDEAIHLLKGGNRRFAANAPQNPDRDEERRRLTASKGQRPFATVLACSDYRVPVETLFDRGIGDIFVVRVAGNVAGVYEVGSIEYGVSHLKTPLLVVLGHTHCGAVTAVVRDAEVDGNILSLVKKILLGVAEVKRNQPGMDDDALVNEAIKANVWQAIEDLFRTSPLIGKKIKHGSLKVLGAIYDIETGKVHWEGMHPRQDELIR